MTREEALQAQRSDTVVYFWLFGKLWCSPILRVNRTTVTVVTSNGERRVDYRACILDPART